MHKPYNEYSVRNWSRSHTHQYMKSGKHIQIMYIKVFVLFKKYLSQSNTNMLYKLVILSPSRKLQFIIKPEFAKLSCALVHNIN